MGSGCRRSFLLVLILRDIRSCLGVEKVFFEGS